MIFNSQEKVKNKEQKSGFKVSENYFDNFENKLFKKIDSETLPLATGFKTPEGYFKNLEIIVLQNLNTEEKAQKVITLNSPKNWLYLAGMAACLAIIISTYIRSESVVKQMDSIKIASIENYIFEGNLDLESYEILALLDDEDLASINFGSDIFSEESLATYLLENSIEETLLIE